MITKKDLMKETAARANISQKETTRILDIFEEVFKEALETQADVKVFDGVIFNVKTVAPRQIRNIQTGAMMDIPEKKKMSVRYGKAIKDFLASIK